MAVTDYTQEVTIWEFEVNAKGQRTFTNLGVFPAREYDKVQIFRNDEGATYQTNKVLYTSYWDIALGHYIALGDFTGVQNPPESSVEVKNVVKSDFFPDEAKAVY